MLDIYERRDIERKIARLKDVRIQYGIVGMNALTVESLERAERVVARIDLKIEHLQDKLEGRA